MARFVPALGLALLAAVASPAGAEDAPAWVMDPAESRLEIAYPGSPVSGGGPFERFDAEIRFDPARPEATRLRVVVETGSLRLRDREARQIAPGPEWLDTAGFPEAVFEAEGARRTGESWTSDGTLTLKGVTAPVAVAYTVETDGERAVATGFATVPRRDFGVGLGDREEDRIVAAEIAVRFTVTARRAEEN